MKLLTTLMMGFFLLGMSGVSYGQSLNASASIPQYVNHLNTYFPGLNLQVRSHGPETYSELIKLEDFLNPTLEVLQQTGGQNPWLPDGSLQELSCSKTVCGNGGGPCHTCMVDLKP